MADQNELGRFLKSRRARVSPGQAGLGTVPRRRVTGLRREEVAALAGISVEYYVRLEQGRASKPSEAVRVSLARALLLDDVEQRYLEDLSRPQVTRRVQRAERVRQELVQLIGMLHHVPALVLNHRLDVLAWNQLSVQLFFDFAAVGQRERNLARFCFLDEGSKERFLDWPDVARSTVGGLRLAAGTHVDDEALATLIGELTMKSPAFRSLWAGRDVTQRTHGVKRFHHPLVGEVPLCFENFDVCGETTQRLTTFIPAPASPAESALELLAMWTLPMSQRPEQAAEGEPAPEEKK